MTIKSLKFSEILRPNFGLIDPGPLVKIHSICSHDTEQKKKILTSVKGHNSVINLRKLKRNNPKLYLVNINVFILYAKFGQIPSICSQEIEWKFMKIDT